MLDLFYDLVHSFLSPLVMIFVTPNSLVASEYLGLEIEQKNGHISPKCLAFNLSVGITTLFQEKSSRKNFRCDCIFGDYVYIAMRLPNGVHLLTSFVC